MTQEIFLNELKIELEKRKVPNVADILEDYREHFEHGRSNGKSDREIIHTLGSSSTLAQAHQAESLMGTLGEKDKGSPQVGVIWSALGKIIVLTPFNFLMLIVPGVFIFTFLVTGWSLTLAVGSLALAAFGAVPYVLTFIGIWPWLAILFTFLAMLSLGVCMTMVMFAATHWIGKILVEYLRWNLKFVLEK